MNQHFTPILVELRKRLPEFAAFEARPEDSLLEELVQLNRGLTSITRVFLSDLIRNLAADGPEEHRQAQGTLASQVDVLLTALLVPHEQPELDAAFAVCQAAFPELKRDMTQQAAYKCFLKLLVYTHKVATVFLLKQQLRDDPDALDNNLIAALSSANRICDSFTENRDAAKDLFAEIMTAVHGPRIPREFAQQLLRETVLAISKRRRQPDSEPPPAAPVH